jgi:hypothetical protein
MKVAPVTQSGSLMVAFIPIWRASILCRIKDGHRHISALHNLILTMGSPRGRPNASGSRRIDGSGTVYELQGDSGGIRQSESRCAVHD